MNQKYYLGLDMANGATGWAVTDTGYEIQKKHGKAMWGVRLYDNASTAEERRLKTGMAIQLKP